MFSARRAGSRRRLDDTGHLALGLSPGRCVNYTTQVLLLGRPSSGAVCVCPSLFDSTQEGPLRRALLRVFWYLSRSGHFCIRLLLSQLLCDVPIKERKVGGHAYFAPILARASSAGFEVLGVVLAVIQCVAVRRPLAVVSKLPSFGGCAAS